MLSALARSALRARAPAATASRTSFTIPILFGRAYSVISEALEHPDASSTASTTVDLEHIQSSKKKALANQQEKDNTKARELKARERERAKARKVREKEREKARKEREKASVKAKKESEKAKKKSEKDKKKREKASVKAKQQKEIYELVEGMLAVPKWLPVNPYTVYMAEHTGDGGGTSFLTNTGKKWAAESEAGREKYRALAEANASANVAAMEKFVTSHKPIEIYKHNKAVRRVQALKQSGDWSTKRVNSVLKAKGCSTLKLLEDPRVPTTRSPSGYVMFTTERCLKEGEGTPQQKIVKSAAEWKALSESEKAEYNTKASKHREEVWKPAMMELFGTTAPSHYVELADKEPVSAVEA